MRTLPGFVDDAAAFAKANPNTKYLVVCADQDEAIHAVQNAANRYPTADRNRQMVLDFPNGSQVLFMSVHDHRSYLGHTFSGIQPNVLMPLLCRVRVLKNDTQPVRKD